MKKQLSLYTKNDFKKADRLERIYLSMIEPDLFEPMLSYDEEAYMKQLHQAYQGCYKQLSRGAAIKFIQTTIQGCEMIGRANRLLDDMQKLYGRFIDKNLALKQSILVEKMYEDAERISGMGKRMADEGNYEAAANMLERANLIREKAAKIEGLDRVNKGWQPEDFELPELVITTDPKALKEPEYEDAEYDEDSLGGDVGAAGMAD